MKKIFKSENFWCAVMAFASLATIVWALVSADAEAASLATGAIVAGAAGGRHVAGGPLTTALTNDAAPELLRNEIDKRVVKIRPMSTPVDQISRSAGSRACGSMKVEYYSVDTKATETTVTEKVGAMTLEDDEMTQITVKVKDGDIIEPTETLLVPDVKNAAGEALVLYVADKPAKNQLKVFLINAGSGQWAGIEKGAKVVRMGRAATELDVQTAQFAALPKKDYNNCQIFKAQVETSTYQKIANKEVGWTFSDQEEVAIIDMRLGMEKNFLFGSRTRFVDPDKKEEVLLTGGIWNQAGKDWTYSRGQLDMAGVVKMMRTAFTDNCGSARKVLVAGSGLIELLNTLDYNRVVTAGDTVTRWGIDFHELRSKFGTLYVVHSEVLDSCGHADDGLIIDPEYITKYSHVPFRTERLDLKKSGVRNTEAVVITEASCLVLRYPSAHVRVTAA